jgi:ABC-type dipeptide/oligopeptide/nickel transport system permease component
MLSYVLDRLKSSILVLFVVSIITFFVLMIIPGNPAQLILGTDATPEAIAELSSAMGLDKPLYQRYLSWLLDLFKLDILLPYISSSLSKTGPSLQTLLFPAFVSMVHPKQAPMPQAILLSKDK